MNVNNLQQRVYCSFRKDFINEEVIDNLLGDLYNLHKNNLKVESAELYNQIVITESEWKANNKKRIREHLEAIGSTQCFKMLDGDKDNLVKKVVQTWYDSKIANRENMESSFSQKIYSSDISWESFLNLTFSQQIESYFNYLIDFLIPLIGKEESITRQVEFYNVEEGKYSNYIFYDNDESLLTVQTIKGSIKIKFRKLELRTHLYQLPQFDILRRRFEKIKGEKGKNLSYKRNILLNESILKFKNEDNQDTIINKISETLCIEPNEYKKLLILSKNNVFLDDKDNLVGINPLNQPLIDMEKSTTLAFYDKIIEGNTNLIEVKGNDGLTKKVKINASGLNLAFVFMNCSPERFLELYDEFKNTNYAIWVFQLWCKINNFSQPIKAIDSSAMVEGDCNIDFNCQLSFDNYSRDVKSYIDKKGINYDQQGGEVFFAWRAKSTEKNSEFYFDCENKTNDEILLENRNKFNSLIDKMSTSTLGNKEIKYLTYFFWYTDKSTWQRTNVRVRSVLNIINRNKKYKPFLEILKLRYGCSSNIIVCLFNYLYHVKLSSVGCELLNDFKPWLLKDSYFVDVCKKISDFVKQNNIYKGKLLKFCDFKNLQYIEMFIGPLLNDGKSPKEMLSQRIYDQHKKQLFINILTEGNNFDYATRLCKLIVKKYWKEVINKYKEKGSLVNDGWNLDKFFKNRQKYATDSSSGGLRGQFHKDGIYFPQVQEQLKGFMPDRPTKKSSFESECSDWFLRVIFSIPATLCDMVMKRNEKAKYRYIYSVTMEHYLMNTVATHLFEEHLNIFGVEVVLNEQSVITHNSNKGFLYNCIDYSEFNDQHEEAHKRLVYTTLHECLSEDPIFGVDTKTLMLCVKWLELSCDLMLIRAQNINTILYQHKGRLFSGERSTTIINSIMSMFYYLLIKINSYILSRVAIKENLTDNDDEAIIREILYCLIRGDTNGSSVSSTLLEKLMLKNTCLGDDGKIICTNIYESLLFNEVAILSGLMLKLQKCLIGVGMSEFLRRIEIKVSPNKTGMLSISKGYVCRAISSMVCGNPEGSDKKNYIAYITQMYESLNTIKVRSNHSDLLTEILEDSWGYISKINQPMKDLNNKSIPDYILYIDKRKGGLGFSNFSNLRYNIKVKLPDLPNPEKFLTTQNRYDIPTEGLDYLVDNVAVKRVAKYGEVNPKKVMERKHEEKRQYIISCNQQTNLYTDEFLLELNNYHLKLAKFAKDIIIYDKSDRYEGNKLLAASNHFTLRGVDGLENIKKRFFSYILNGEGDNSLLVKDITKINAFKRDLDLLKLSEDQKLARLNLKFGIGASLLYKLNDAFYEGGNELIRIENAQYNLVFSMFFNSLSHYIVSDVDITHGKLIFEWVLREITI